MVYVAFGSRAEKLARTGHAPIRPRRASSVEDGAVRILDLTGARIEARIWRAGILGEHDLVERLLSNDTHAIFARDNSPGAKNDENGRH
jgi:hypothetical protein